MRFEMKRLTQYALGLFGILLVWSICLASAQKIQNLQTSMELRYSKPTLTLKQLEKIQKEETDHEKKLITSLVAWEQTGQVDLNNKSLDKSVKSAMIHTWGDIKALIPKKQLTGDLIYEGDFEGAIITKKVAYDLWGSLDVLDKTFNYGDKEYTVRGILNEEIPAVVVQLNKNEEDDIKLSQLRVQFIDSENIERQVEIFRGRYGLEETTTINLSLSSILLGQIVYLPMWIVGIWGLIKLFKLLYDTYHYWVAALILLGIMAIATWMIGRLMGIQFNIPSYLIPNEWSDFQFWSKLWEKLRSNYLEVQSLPKYLPDMWREDNVQILVGTWGISSVATVLGMRKLDIRSGTELFAGVLVAVIISFTTVIVSYGLGIIASVPQAFWLMIPIFLTIQYICNNWTKLFE